MACQFCCVFIFVSIKAFCCSLRFGVLVAVARHIRQDENNIPKSGEESINAIDQLAYIHDLAYQNSNNIEDQGMINGLKQLKNLSIPQRLIRQFIIRLFQAKIKLGQRTRATKTEAIQNLYVSKGAKTNQESKQEKLANELHKPF